jgi:hypothetical protein
MVSLSLSPFLPAIILLRCDTQNYGVLLCTGVWTQSFVLARQIFYPFSHVSSHFSLIILKTESCFFCAGWPGPQSYFFKLPAVIRVTGVHHHTQLLSFEVGSCKLFALATLEPHPPPLISSSCVGMTGAHTAPSCWLRRVLMNFLPWPALSHSTFDLCLPSS